MLEECRNHPKIDGHPVYGGSGVYFLMKDGALVYVGKAKNVAQRIGSHAGRKDFDSFKFFKCESPLMDWLEVQIIKELQPPLNIACLKGRRAKQPYFTEAVVISKKHPNGFPVSKLPKEKREMIEAYIAAGGFKNAPRKPKK